MSDLAPLDLLNDLDTLSTLLRTELVAASDGGGAPGSHTVDAFLLAAGMSQIAEDDLHRQPHALDVVVRRSRGSSAAPALASLAAAAGSVGRIGDGRLLEWHARLTQIVRTLAALTLHSQGTGCSRPVPRSLCDEADRVLDVARRLPARLRRSVIRMPESFRSFDQRPDDCTVLAELFAGHAPGRDRPVLVVGVRTSGSYLAPLQAAALTALGYGSVDAMTFRPGQPWLEHELCLIAAHRRAGGLVLVIDDPPVSGRKLAATADTFERIGFPRSDVVLLVPLLGSAAAVPAALGGRAIVSLPWKQWAFHRELEPPALLRTLSELLIGMTVSDGQRTGRLRVAEVLEAKRLELEPVDDALARPLARSHVRLRCRARVADAAHRHVDVDVYIKGTGLGYLGRHSLEVSRRLTGLVPPVFGWKDGLLYRQLLPEGTRLTRDDPRPGADVAVSIAEYASARARLLPVAEDTSRRLSRRHAAWQLSADLLASRFDGAAGVARPLLRVAARRMLEASRPSIVDGSTSLSNWFHLAEGTERWLKVDYDERAFSGWDTFSYDGAWDIAVAAADQEIRAADGVEQSFGHTLRRTYERHTGAVVSDERWVLLQLVHVLSVRRHAVRLLRQGPGQLQTRSGTPPATPDVDEPGFRQELLTRVWECDRAIGRVVSRHMAALAGLDVEVQAPRETCALRAEGLLEASCLGADSLTYAGAISLRALRVHGFGVVLIGDPSLAEMRRRCGIYGAIGAVAERGCAVHNHESGRDHSILTPAVASRTVTVRREATRCGQPVLDGYSHVVATCGDIDDTGRLQPPVEHIPDEASESQALSMLLIDLGIALSVPPISSTKAVSGLLGHAPGTCVRCRPPQLTPQAQLVLAALDGGDASTTRRLLRTVTSLARFLATTGEPRPQTRTSRRSSLGCVG